MQVKKQIHTVNQKLEVEFGIPIRKQKMNPLDNLILTILSQNTNDKNRDAAYGRLRNIFPDWYTVMNADVYAIRDAIRIAGLGNQKSHNIKNLLRWIHHFFGELNINRICANDPWETIELFCKQKGIGIKTMAVVLCFSCEMDIFPVDTHVHRICRRLGFVSQKVSAEKTFWIMKDLVPIDKSYSLHLNFLRLGRTICLARKPKCEKCVLTSCCNYFLANIK